MEPEHLLDGLNAAQRRAVTSAVVPLRILAGAGSGKTRVLTRRIAYRAATGQHDPRRVLALTFTRKAAGELSTRLRALGMNDRVAAGTFHAIAYAQLRNRWAEHNVTPPTLLDRKVGFVARLIPSNLASPGRGPGGRGAARDVLPLDVVAEIEWAKCRRITPSAYAKAATEAKRKPPLEPKVIADLYERYETEKKRRRMVDFDDLLVLCIRDLVRDEEFAAAQRWRYRHFFVDEYQDVNPLQQGLLDAWLGDRPDLCVVGDPNQAIYAWNGADAHYLNDFDTTWKRGETVQLTENYRSSPQILAVANAVLAGSAAARRAMARGATSDSLIPNRPDGPIPEIRSFPDDKAEARAIARAVRDAHAPGTPWSSQAILVRTNAQTSVLEAALRLAQVPARTRGGSALLDQPEVKGALRDLRSARGDFVTALADLTLSTKAAPRLGGGAIDGFGAALDAPPRRSARADEPARSDGSAGAGGPADDDPLDDDDDVAPDGATEVEIEADSREANVQALVRLGHDYAALTAQPSTAGFLEWLSTANRNEQADAAGDAVEITTFHAAKGLEWPVVHLAGLEQGLVPIGHAQTASEIAEERRLFYVAVTRAERDLRCTWAESRTFGMRTAARERSPYLGQVEAACAALKTNEVPADWRAFFAARHDAEAESGRLVTSSGRAAIKKGRAGGALSDLDDDGRRLFDALKEWRSTVARAASVPAYVVFHDTTLEAIAAAKPRSNGDLLALPGLGPVKVGRYGEGVLAVVADHR